MKKLSSIESPAAWNQNPLFSAVGGLQKLSSTSPAINYAKGTYSFVTTDMDGETRSIPDAGADDVQAPQRSRSIR